MPTYSNSKHWQICLFIPESENSQDTVCWVTLLWGAQGFMISAGCEVDVRYLRPTGLKDSAEKLLRFWVDLYNSVHFCLRGNWGRCSRVTWSFHRYLNCETLRELATWGKNIQCINATLIPAGHRFEVRCSSIPLPEIQDQIKLELEPFNMKITVAKWGCAYSCLDPSCEELTCLLAAESWFQPRWDWKRAVTSSTSIKILRQVLVSQKKVNRVFQTPKFGLKSDAR